MPSASAADIASIFQQNTNAIRLGMIFLIIAALCLAPFVAVIALYVRRIEAGSPLMAYIQLITGTTNVLLFLISPLIWTAIAYRPERAPEITQIANDLAWILYLMPVTPFMLQTLSIGCAILSDKSEHPIFSRWLGFFNLWIPLASIPGLMLTFFKTGPFAWNGIFAFYIPALTFFVWDFVMFVSLIKAIKLRPAD